MSRIIRLTDAEVELARRISAERHSKSGGHTYRERGWLDVGTLGALAEVAFSKMTGLEIDRNVYPGGDAGCDFLYKGKRWEVKCRDTGRLKHPDLLVKTDKADKADNFVLAYTNDTSVGFVTMVGYCSRDYLMSRPVVNFGHGDRYMVKPDELTDIRDK